MKLIITSAWNPSNCIDNTILQERRRRLVESLWYYSDLQIFDQITLIDSTLDKKSLCDLACQAPRAVDLVSLKTHPDGSYKGTSYLEALLLIEYFNRCGKDFVDVDNVFKITGGYKIRNIVRIIELYSKNNFSALGFKIQNPFILRPRYAMTACMGMTFENWHNFIFLLKNQLEALRETPLESFYSQHLVSVGAKHGKSLPFPIIDAFFGNYGRSNQAISYRARELVWYVLCRIGLFNLTV